jgi:hypothetical protein
MVMRRNIVVIDRGRFGVEYTSHKITLCDCNNSLLASELGLLQFGPKRTWPQ